MPPGQAVSPAWETAGLTLRAAGVLLAGGSGVVLALGLAGWGHFIEPHRAWLLALWAWLFWLAASAGDRAGRPGAALWVSAWLLAAGAHLLSWRGLVERGVLAEGWQPMLGLFSPLIVCALGGALTVWALQRTRGLGDPVIAAAVFGLFGLGLTLLARLAPELTAEGRREVLAYLAWRQAAWFGLGLLALAAGALWASPRRLARLTRRKYLLPIAAAGLLLATWLAGPEINGRRLWLTLGGLSLQTVELVKLLMVLFVAAYFSAEHPHLLADQAGRRPRGMLAVAGPYALMQGLPLMALAVQRDFGPAVLLYGFFLLMLYLGSGARRLVLGGALLLPLLGVLGYWFKVPAMLHFRVRAWLDPFTASEQLTRGLWALASGGAWGQGWGQGRPQVVPLSYSDFAFTALSEEMGLAGGLAVLSLLGILAWRGMAIAAASATPQRRLLAGGPHPDAGAAGPAGPGRGDRPDSPGRADASVHLPRGQRPGGQPGHGRHADADGPP